MSTWSRITNTLINVFCFGNTSTRTPIRVRTPEPTPEPTPDPNHSLPLRAKKAAERYACNVARRLAAAENNTTTIKSDVTDKKMINESDSSLSDSYKFDCSEPNMPRTPPSTCASGALNIKDAVVDECKSIKADKILPENKLVCNNKGEDKIIDSRQKKNCQIVLWKEMTKNNLDVISDRKNKVIEKIKIVPSKSKAKDVAVKSSKPKVSGRFEDIVVVSPSFVQRVHISVEDFLFAFTDEIEFPYETSGDLIHDIKAEPKIQNEIKKSFKTKLPNGPSELNKIKKVLPKKLSQKQNVVLKNPVKEENGNINILTGKGIVFGKPSVEKSKEPLKQNILEKKPFLKKEEVLKKKENKNYNIKGNELVFTDKGRNVFELVNVKKYVELIENLTNENKQNITLTFTSDNSIVQNKFEIVSVKNSIDYKLCVTTGKDAKDPENSYIRYCVLENEHREALKETDVLNKTLKNLEQKIGCFTKNSNISKRGNNSFRK